MNTLRDKLVTALGGAGIAVWYVLSLVYTFADRWRHNPAYFICMGFLPRPVDAVQRLDTRVLHLLRAVFFHPASSHAACPLLP